MSSELTNKRTGIVLVCGGRDWSDWDLTMEALSDFAENLPNLHTLIHGGARGADTLAGIWAHQRGLTQTVFKAEWDKYGKAAGHIRNKQMLVEGKPDLVLAFPGGKGTQNMVDQAIKAGVEVWKYAGSKAIWRLENPSRDSVRDSSIQHGRSHLWALGAYGSGASPRSMVDNTYYVDVAPRRERSK